VPRVASSLARLYQLRASQLQERLSTFAIENWNALGEWSAGENAAFAEIMGGTSTQAQTVLVQMLSSMVTRQVGTPAEIDLSAVVGDASRPDDGIVGAWEIPMQSAWKHLADGDLTQDELVSMMQDEVSSQAITDLAQSQRLAMSDLYARGIVQGYWRVPNPGSSCDFCNEIADRLYYTEDLMPVHPNCQCTVEVASAEEVAAEA
jgi:hypothetical protein